MSDAPKPSREEVIELLKSARDQAKAERPVSMADLAKGLGSSIRSAMDEAKAELVKMRTLEVSALKKNVSPGGTGAGAAPSMSKPPMAPMMKTVFELLKPKAKAEVAKAEDRIDGKHENDPEKRLTDDGKRDGAVLPTDKKAVEIKRGSGGMEKDELDGDAAGMDPGMEKSQKSVFAVLKKGLAGPKLGGKDPGSKAMTQDAMSAGAKAAPATATTLPKTKMPTMEQHAERANSYADFMPKGKFDKSEWEGKVCPYCHKPLEKCVCA